MIALLAFAGTICLVGWLAVHQITVASLHRAVRRGQIDPRPGTVVRPVRLAALGVNPDAHYRYVPYDVPPGTVLLLDGRAHPMRTYLSLALYDRNLQSSPGRGGPTWVVDPPVDTEGRFALALAHSDPGMPWLDVSAHPRGVLLERHLGPEPTGATRLGAACP
ncbi:MAG: hypothetical protein H6736_08460 [Alphaproteobacteria bacterium]|nr:hypothetical protein [Alphaproteobacteria bacterium]MCB9691833.1 hypothetical protein [Alphaproteobacteria bacterium]